MDQRHLARERKRWIEGEQLERVVELLRKGQIPKWEISKIGGISRAFNYRCLKTDLSLC